jgi:hypothetical protein
LSPKNDLQLHQGETPTALKARAALFSGGGNAAATINRAASSHAQNARCRTMHNQNQSKSPQMMQIVAQVLLQICAHLRNLRTIRTSNMKT